MQSIRFLFSLVVVVFLITGAQAQTSQAEKITLEEFEQKLKQQTHPQILDVRSSQEFSENHLKGAINLNASDETVFQKGVNGLSKKSPVFVYSINNGRSGVVAKKLRELGFSEVYELPGGLAHWLGAGKPVEATAATNTITASEFEKLVASNNVVLVDVGSKYCGGCKKLNPVVDAVAKDQGDLLNVVKIELYDNRELAAQLNIESVPTLILYKNNKPVWRKSGNISRTDIQDALDNSL